jgi:heat-inducible transcriptional repressor
VEQDVYELTPRRRKILELAVNDYILTALPVASSRLVKVYSLGYSPATARGDLAFLEDLGYLKQPHVSAGRIPTEKGYRYYAEVTKERASLSPRERSYLLRIFRLNKQVEELFKEITMMLSQLTGYLAIVFIPPIKVSYFKHLDLIPLSPFSLLSVLITSSGQVAKQLIEFSELLSEEELKEVERDLNEKLDSLCLEKIEDLANQLATKTAKNKLAVQIIKGIIDFLRREELEDIYLSGTHYLLQQPDFDNPEELVALLNALENRGVLFPLLRETLRQKQVVVKIGSENPPVMRACSYVGFRYEVGDRPMGGVGLLGPARLRYPQAIAALRLASQKLSETLSAWYS